MKYFFSSGHFLLTNLLLDVMKSSGSGRIINVAASAYKLGEINFDDINGEKEPEFNSGKQFSQSKLAVILFNQELARRLEGDFFIDTKIDKSAAASLIKNSLNALIHLSRQCCGFFKTCFFFTFVMPADCKALSFVMSCIFYVLFSLNFLA